MRSAAKLKIRDHDDLIPTEGHNPFSLWTGPSSPPFHHPPPAPLGLDPSLASSPSTPSEFEFDSIASLDINHDPPVSPRLIPSFATQYWGATVLSPLDNSPLPPDHHHHHHHHHLQPPIAPPLSHPITSTTKPPSAPPSTSVRQLMAEETCGEHNDDFDLDFYSAPQTRPSLAPPRRITPDPEQKSLIQDDEPSLSIVSRVGRRKSSSAAGDRHAHVDELAGVMQKNQLLQSSKSDPNSHFANLWAYSFAWEKSEEEEKSGVKKQGSKSSKKWAFKDLLRRTVPSSKAEAHYITTTMGASSSKKYLSSSKSNPNISPLASPMHSTSLSTPASSRPSTPGRSPTHRSSTPTARSSPRHPSMPNCPSAQSLNSTPTPSPPRSPLSPHAIHYQQNKAQSLELTKKTFLPYRQSLLGCLGGPGAFPPEQQAW